MTYFLLGVLAVTVGTSFARGGDLLSPSRIYICVYSLLLSVYHLHLSRLQTPWSTTSIILFCGASGMFLASGLWIWLTGKVRFPDWKLDFAEVRAGLQRNAAAMDWTWFYRIWIWSVGLYLFSYAISAFLTGGIPVFMPDPDEARLRFIMATPVTNYGIFLGPTSLMLGVELLWFSNLSDREKWRVRLLQFLVFLTYSAMITRYDLFRFIIFSMVLYHYGKRRLGVGMILGVISLILTLFFIGMLIRVNMDLVDSFNEVIKVKMPKHLAWASNIYAYIANDFWNFDYAVRKYVDGDHHYGMQYGVGLFRAFLFNLRLEHPLISSYGFDSLFNESAAKVQGLNTVIYVWHFYKDFGFIGVFLLPFIFGLLLWKFYLNSMMAPTLFRLSIWGLLAGGLALSYHTPLWELWFIYLNLLVVAIAHRKFRLS